ncbi:general stress protein [Sporosarcina sp. E16_8]|uniref:general stress protein n=1 Tax=Sporosarcina sp. E16_8 TaxID=2789295 RepID=UPI001A917A36|nr:general stress protein [Sporosarcina sp. E16_8]MBO0586646.1 general stress protein [Sporosarcina sp. E16_8]
MENKKYLVTFHSIDTVLYKITELKAQGYDESDMYAVTNEEDNISMLRGQTDAELLGRVDENWLGCFQLFLSGEEPILNAFSRMGFSEQQIRGYFKEVKSGGVALVVKSKALDEMDSSTERGLSGEPLDAQDGNQQMIDNDGTVPRLNTRNL